MREMSCQEDVQKIHKTLRYFDIEPIPESRLFLYDRWGRYWRGHCQRLQFADWWNQAETAMTLGKVFVLEHGQ